MYPLFLAREYLLSLFIASHSFSTQDISKLIYFPIKQTLPIFPFSVLFNYICMSHIYRYCISEKGPSTKYPFNQKQKSPKSFFSVHIQTKKQKTNKTNS